MDISSEFKQKVWYVLLSLLLLAGVSYVLVRGFHVVLLILLACIFGVVLEAAASWVSTRTKLPHGVSLGFVLLLIIAALVLFFVFFVPALTQQLGQLGNILPQSSERITELTAGIPVVERLGQFDTNSLSQLMRNNTESILSQVGGVFSSTFNFFFDVVVILAVAMYGAFAPQTYKKGLLYPFPPDRQPAIAGRLACVTRTLRRWMLGRLASMVVVAVLTYIALLLLGVPLALPLAVLAGLLSFIPNLGPILSVLPAIVVGLSVGLATTLYIIILYIVVQFIESYFITPYIEQQVVNVPPAALLALQVLFGIVFGLMGLLLAAPVIAVVIALMREYYTPPATLELAPKNSP